MCSKLNSGASGSSIAQHNWQSEHRTWQQRGGYNGYRIPDDRYRGYFGPSHGFRIFSLHLVIFGGYPTLPVRRLLVQSP